MLYKFHRLNHFVQLYLISGAIEIATEVPPNAASAIEQQLERIDSEEKRRAFVEAMLIHLSRVLSGFLDPDLRPPTEKQVIYAVAIAKKHFIEVPRDALIYRFAMNDFLDKYGK